MKGTLHKGAEVGLPAAALAVRVSTDNHSLTCTTNSNTRWLPTNLPQHPAVTDHPLSVG